MRRHTTRNDVAVECGNCGRTSGRRTKSGLRCGDCGRFAVETDGYCAVHDLDIRSFPRGYDHCPKCREIQRVEAERQEMMARRADPNMHPTVDAPRR